MAQADKQMPLAVIFDGQGGGIGRGIAEHLLHEKLPIRLIVVGTNAVATSNMMKAGVSTGATGENACVYNCAQADIIIGPIGIVFPNAMHGEISSRMTNAVMESAAEKVLVPVANNHVQIVGLQPRPLAQTLDEMAEMVRRLLPPNDEYNGQ